jgi:serine/threonine protein kinase
MYTLFIIKKGFTMSLDQLEHLSMKELRTISERFDLPSNGTKRTLLKQIRRTCDELEKYINYKHHKQLGVTGKDGTTVLVTAVKNNQEYAMKMFRPSKSKKSIEREIYLHQRGATKGISPRIYDFSLTGKYIVMDRLDTTLYEVFLNQKGELTLSQQKSIIKLFNVLDRIGIFHGDPNPLNFMSKGAKWFIIDYGFALEMDADVLRRYGTRPNVVHMTKGLIKHLQNIHPQTTLNYLCEWARRTSK